MIIKPYFLHALGTATCALFALRRPEVTIWILLAYVAFSAFHYWHRVRLLDLNRLPTLVGWCVLAASAFMLPARPKSFALFIVSQLFIFELIGHHEPQFSRGRAPIHVCIDMGVDSYSQ